MSYTEVRQVPQSKQAVQHRRAFIINAGTGARPCRLMSSRRQDFAADVVVFQHEMLPEPLLSQD